VEKKINIKLGLLEAGISKDAIEYVTHTIVLLLYWNLSRTTRASRYQKGKTRKVKTNLDLLEQEIVSGSGICWATTQFFTGRMPFLRPFVELLCTLVYSYGCDDTNLARVSSASVMPTLITCLIADTTDFSSCTETKHARIILYMLYNSLYNQATRYASQHIWCLSQARIN